MVLIGKAIENESYIIAPFLFMVRKTVITYFLS